MMGETVLVGAARVVIIDDHAVLADALAQTLLANGIEAAEAVAVRHPDTDKVLEATGRVGANVALLDLHLGETELATPLVAPLVEHGVAVLVLTASDDAGLLADCLHRGAAGVFPKSLPFTEVLELVRRAAAGEPVMSAAQREDLLSANRLAGAASHARLEPFERLTERERYVLRALMEGRTAAEIATASHVSIHTVRTQVKAVLRKLDVNNQIAAVAKARDAGWAG